MLGLHGEIGEDADPSPAVVRELHRDLVRQQRRKFLSASPLLLLAVLGVAAGMTAPRKYGGIIGFSFVIAFVVGQMGWEWLRLRKADPIALYQRERHEAEEQRANVTAHLLRSSEVKPVVTIALTVTIGLVTLIQFMATDERHAVQAAGLVKAAARGGEWWRLLSATYLHGNLLHVVSNLGALVTFGQLIEVYERRMQVPLVYLCSALGGSALSTMLTSASSIGASGGVLGLAGYVLTVAGRQSGGTPAWIRRAMLPMLASTALMGIAAFMFIDNAGHVGGVVTGAAMGYAGRSTRFLEVPASVVLVAGAVFTAGRLIAAW